MTTSNFLVPQVVEGLRADTAQLQSAWFGFRFECCARFQFLHIGGVELQWREQRFIFESFFVAVA